ncbi:MAG: undecaprenyl-phosphate glucose phosphotransferase [Betaproteobacteria bacterium]|nr:undecaprenyl-phosphate glucose phosphotransferase [Betaproteobacteria bacterium]
MSTLATEYPPVGTELPLVALVRTLLAPAVCVLTLALCLAAYHEPLAPRHMTLAVVVFLLSIWVFGELPLTNGRSKLSFLLPGRAILAGWFTVIGILLFAAFVTKVSALYSRAAVLTWFVVTPFALQFAQELARLLLHRLVSSSAAGRIKVVVGVNDTARKLASRIREDPCMGTVAGYFDDRAGERLGGVKPQDMIGRLANVAPSVKRHGIDVVYITLPMTRDPRMMRLLDELRDTTASIYFVPSTLPFEPIQARLDYIGGVPVIAVCETPFCGINGVLKRAFDLVVASVVLLLIWPLMLAIAISVKRSAPGPVLFKQRRYGLDGKEILVCKFRTMTVCEDGNRIEQATKNDRRITPLGALLRRTSLDELPQLFNVLAGSMSIVGPRPHAVAHNEEYRGLIDGYMIRHKVKPGITGWAQVNGCRGETETVDKMRKRIEYDLDYLKHWSVSLDLWILARTAWVVVNDRNAY